MIYLIIEVMVDCADWLKDEDGGHSICILFIPFS